MYYYHIEEPLSGGERGELRKCAIVRGPAASRLSPVLFGRCERTTSMRYLLSDVSTGQRQLGVMAFGACEKL